MVECMLVLSINLTIWQRVRLREKKHISKEHLYNFGLNKIFELKFLGRVPRKTKKKMQLYNKFEGYCSEMLSPHNFNGIALTSFGIFVFTNGLFFYFCKQGLLEIMTSKVTKIYRYHNDSKRQEQNQELPFHRHPTLLLYHTHLDLLLFCFRQLIFKLPICLPIYLLITASCILLP